MTDIIDLNDNFNDETINPDLWPELANFSYTDQNTGLPFIREYDSALRSEYHNVSCWVPGEWSWPRYHGTRWEVEFPYSGPTLKLELMNTAMQVYVTISNDYVFARMAHNYNDEWPETYEQLNGTFRYFRVYRKRHWYDFEDPEIPDRWANTDYMYVDASEDGVTWQNVVQLGEYNTGSLDDPWTIYMELGFVNIYDVRGITVGDSGEGSTGASGSSGPSGSIGETGSSGPTGSIDTQTGPSGSIGPTGPSGTSGSTGPSGTETGSSGPSGVDEPSGPSGSTGPSGTDEPSGSTGSSGATGNPGGSGATGPSGSGETGSTGATGGSGAPSGASGPSGSTGPSGSSGASGSTGPSGASGPRFRFPPVVPDDGPHCAPGVLDDSR